LYYVRPLIFIFSPLQLSPSSWSLHLRASRFPKGTIRLARFIDTSPHSSPRIKMGPKKAIADEAAPKRSLPIKQNPLVDEDHSPGRKYT
jgi:hypothetical protein